MELFVGEDAVPGFLRVDAVVGGDKILDMAPPNKMDSEGLICFRVSQKIATQAAFCSAKDSCISAESSMGSSSQYLFTATIAACQPSEEDSAASKS
jgi:hypothetical protein